MIRAEPGHRPGRMDFVGWVDSGKGGFDGHRLPGFLELLEDMPNH